MAADQSRVGSGRLTGRDGRRMPADLADAGVRLFASDRRDSAALATVFGSGADLLVDAVCFTADDAATLMPHLADVTATAIPTHGAGRCRPHRRGNPGGTWGWDG